MTQALGTGKGLEATTHMTPQIASQSSHEFFFPTFFCQFWYFDAVLQVPSRIPGYGGPFRQFSVQLSPLHENVRTMVTELLWLLTPWWNARNIPGKLSETVHGARFAEVNAAVGCSVAQMGTRHAHGCAPTHEFDTAF